MKPDILLLPGFMLDAGLWNDMLHPGNGLAQLGHLHFGDLGQDDSIEKMALRRAAPVLDIMQTRGR